MRNNKNRTHENSSAKQNRNVENTTNYAIARNSKRKITKGKPIPIPRGPGHDAIKVVSRMKRKDDPAENKEVRNETVYIPKRSSTRLQPPTIKDEVIEIQSDDEEHLSTLLQTRKRRIIQRDVDSDNDEPPVDRSLDSNQRRVANKLRNDRIERIAQDRLDKIESAKEEHDRNERAASRLRNDRLDRIEKAKAEHDKNERATKDNEKRREKVREEVEAREGLFERKRRDEKYACDSARAAARLQDEIISRTYTTPSRKLSFSKASSTPFRATQTLLRMNATPYRSDVNDAMAKTTGSFIENLKGSAKARLVQSLELNNVGRPSSTTETLNLPTRRHKAKHNLTLPRNPFKESQSASPSIPTLTESSLTTGSVFNVSPSFPPRSSFEDKSFDIPTTISSFKDKSFDIHSSRSAYKDISKQSGTYTSPTRITSPRISTITKPSFEDRTNDDPSSSPNHDHLVNSVPDCYELETYLASVLKDELKDPSSLPNPALKAALTSSSSKPALSNSTASSKKSSASSSEEEFTMPSEEFDPFEEPVPQLPYDPIDDEPLQPIGSDEHLLTYPFEGKKSVTIYERDIVRLKEYTYLNDSLVDILPKIWSDEFPTDKVYTFSSFFYTKLSGKETGIDFDKVKRWTANVNIFQKELIIVPVAQYNHWYLVVITNPDLCIKNSGTYGLRASTIDEATTESTTRPRRKVNNLKAGTPLNQNKSYIMILDPLHGKKTDTCERTREYLKQEAMDKMNIEEEDFIEPEFVHIDCPNQKNAFDCGVFCLNFIRSLYTKTEDMIEVLYANAKKDARWDPDNELPYFRQILKRILKRKMNLYKEYLKKEIDLSL